MEYCYKKYCAVIRGLISMLDVPPSYTKAEKSSASAGNIFWGGEGENQAGEGGQKVHSLI